MVLDNADDDDVFFSADEDGGGTAQTSEAMRQKRPLATFLPQAPHGLILITSRNSTAASNLVGTYDDIVKVEPMEVEDALALLRTRVSISGSDEDDAKALVQALECIPLAITHAASYIKTRAPMTTIASYLQFFRESEANQARLLDAKELRDLRRDPSIRHAVIATWKISFDQIQKTGPAAAELLALMSMFDRQGIPVSLLQGQVSRLDFEDAVAPLLSFSLVRAEIGQQSFEMHHLVQLSTRRWLEANDQLDRWKTESVRMLAEVFPSGEYETWVECRQLLPHSRKVLDYNQEEREAALHWARIARNTGWYLLYIGEYAAAADSIKDAMLARERLLGAEHPDTLTSVSQLGTVLSSRAEYEEAEAMQRRALAGYEKALGVEHPHTLTSVSQLGTVLSSQGKYEEAEAIQRRALAGEEKVLGVEHLHTLISVSQLGTVLSSQGKYEEAEAMHRRALAGEEKALGVEHPDTLTSMANLASTFWRQGRLNEAEDLEVCVMETRKRVLGDEHPATLTAMINLALTLKSRSRNQEALTLLQTCVQMQTRVLGGQHPDTESSLETLAEWKMESMELGN